MTDDIKLKLDYQSGPCQAEHTMLDHYNGYELKRFARTVAECLGTDVPDSFAPSISWLPAALKARHGGTADRAVLYHADAVPMYIWQEQPDLFVPVILNSEFCVPARSTIESVTPVAHASEYTGLDPKGHGIQTYVRPQLTCTTLFDIWVKEGKKVAIITMTDSTFLHIFAGRDVEYYEFTTHAELREKAVELIASNKYDIISIHTQMYDDAAHAYGPESKEGINAILTEAEGYAVIANAIRKHYGPSSRTLFTYTPDHGQHYSAPGRGAHGSLLVEDMNVIHYYSML